MIITRTPLRISLGGGGTDLASYYSRFRGFVVTAAIDQYVYITLHQTFQKNYIVKYSALETVMKAEDIQHPILREALVKHAMAPYLEIVSMADIPAGTGLGSSGAFTVGLLKAIHSFKHEPIAPQALAEEACDIEINRLNEPIGKQDQYIASFGGLICMEIEKGGHVNVSPLVLPPPTMHDLEDNLLMFFTGYSRNASLVLADQKKRTETNDADMIANLDFIKDLGISIKQALEGGRADEFGRLMHEHWVHKQKRSSGMSNENINRWYDVARSNGAAGGKLIGAGGGGFLLFYATDRKALRQAMMEQGLTEVRFRFDHEGSKVLVRS
jgi:D-glycero-alpha-D-manno-heptose-7-phosphate kinase